MNLDPQAIQLDLARRKAEIAEIEGAWATLARVYGATFSASPAPERIAVPASSLPENLDPQGGRVDLSGRTIADAARAILADAGEPLRVDDIARRALDRGYRGSKADAGFDVTQKSFATILRQNPAFISDGQKRYRIADPGDSSFSLESPRQKPHRPTRDDRGTQNRRKIITELLGAKGSPMTTREITEGLIAQGHSLPKDSRSAHNSTFGSLKHYDDIIVKLDNFTWGLKEWAAKAETPGDDNDTRG